MSKIKKMCKANNKDYKEIKKELKELVNDPKFVCKKCLRVSNNEDKLCKPDEL